MKFYASIVALGLAALTMAAPSADLVLEEKRDSNNTAVCLRGGYKCDSLNTIWECTELGQWDKIEECPVGSRCQFGIGYFGLPTCVNNQELDKRQACQNNVFRCSWTANGNAATIEWCNGNNWQVQGTCKDGAHCRTLDSGIRAECTYKPPCSAYDC